MLDQGELFDIPNPCRGICEVNNRGYCKGCLRSRTERFHWQDFTPFQKQLVVNACARRRLKIAQAANRAELPHSVTEPLSTAVQQADLFSPVESLAEESTVTTPAIEVVKSPSPAADVEQPPRPAIDPHQQIDLF